MDAGQQLPGATARFQVCLIHAEKHTEKQAEKQTELANRKTRWKLVQQPGNVAKVNEVAKAAPSSIRASDNLQRTATAPAQGSTKRLLTTLTSLPCSATGPTKNTTRCISDLIFRLQRRWRTVRKGRLRMVKTAVNPLYMVAKSPRPSFVSKEAAPVDPDSVA